MAIKFSQAIPETIPDGSDPQALVSFLIAMKQCITELSNNSQSSQGKVMTTVPTAKDFDTDNQSIYYDDGTNRRIYSLVNGVVRVQTLT